MTDEVETAESIADVLTETMAAAESEPETEEAPDSISQEAVTETEEVVEAQADTEETVEEDDDESGEPEKVFTAPEHWSSDERASFDSLPPEAKELVLTRDAQFQTGYQEKAQAISAITDAIEPFKESLIRRGVTAEQAIGLLFNAQERLDSNPLDGILQIAQSYGIVDQLREQFAPKTDEEDFTDPGIRALQLEIKGLKNQMDQTNAGIQRQGASVVQQQIDTFQSAKDADGNLKHPHFEQIKTLMGSYVQGGDTLDAAYEKAVWTVAEFRESQNKRVVEKTDEQKAEKVKKAKRAARGVRTNGKADPAEGAETQSLHDDLTEAFRQHSS